MEYDSSKFNNMPAQRPSRQSHRELSGGYAFHESSGFPEGPMKNMKDNVPEDILSHSSIKTDDYDNSASCGVVPSNMEYRLDSECGNYALLRGVTNSPFPEDTSNKVDFSTELDYGEMKFNNCLMYLEPRLQEYVKRKEYYTKNSITPSIGLEESYGISKSDLIKIKKLSSCKNEKNCGLVQTSITQRTLGRPKCGNVTTSQFVKREGDKFKIHDRGMGKPIFPRKTNRLSQIQPISINTQDSTVKSKSPSCEQFRAVPLQTYSDNITPGATFAFENSDIAYRGISNVNRTVPDWRSDENNSNTKYTSDFVVQDSPQYPNVMISPNDGATSDLFVQSNTFYNSRTPQYCSSGSVAPAKTTKYSDNYNNSPAACSLSSINGSSSCNSYKNNRVFTNDNFNNFNQYYKKQDPEKDWKQVFEQKPMKYRLLDHFSPTIKNFPGVNQEPRNINQHEINQDTFLRPSYVDQDTSGISRESHMDTCYKIVLPGGRNNSCYTDEYLNTSFYLTVPYMGSGAGQGNVSLESEMKDGQLTRFKQKKTGGEPLDRFFDLDRDIQDPGHIVLPFPRGGVDTRAIDKWAKKDAQYVV
jgi:hypothetical protein